MRTSDTIKGEIDLNFMDIAPVVVILADIMAKPPAVN